MQTQPWQDERVSSGTAESRTAILRIAEAFARLPGKDGVPFAELLQHGSLSVEIFAPRGVDTQEPHARDEIYVVVKGSGEFVYGSRRARVSTGDFLFVPARLEHRFENFSPDLTLWVIFYGPDGGERP
ncbi:MAG: cupin domain-containing protein [Gammaproteobacteria bacterium]